MERLVVRRPSPSRARRRSWLRRLCDGWAGVSRFDPDGYLCGHWDCGYRYCDLAARGLHAHGGEGVTRRTAVAGSPSVPGANRGSVAREQQKEGPDGADEKEPD